MSTVRRLVLSCKDRERYIELGPGKDYLIGRLLETDFFLNDPSVSRRHCVLRATATGVELEDLVSRNSTLLNGQRVLTRTLLGDGSVLQIGKLTFTIKILDERPSIGTVHIEPEAPAAPAASGETLRAIIEAQGYVVKEQLAGGPTTFRVERVGLGRPFVIRAIETAGVNRERVDQLRAEARLLATLEHPSITAIFDVLEADGVLLVVVAHETGEPLDALVKRIGPLPEKQAIAIARRCAEAVRHASERGVIHREVAPSNVLIGKDYPRTLEVRLANFPPNRDLGELSRPFSTGGDLDRLVFVAPEVVARGSDASVRADVFGIGAVLLYSLTGRSPYGERVDPSLHVKRVVAGMGIHPVLDGVSERLQGVLGQLLATDPDGRPGSADSALELLATTDSERAVRSIEGAFADDELVEYIQLLELNHKTGILEIWNEECSGRLGFQEGRLDAATAQGSPDGMPAARRLVSLPRGNFRFVPGQKAPGSGLKVNLAGLLLDVVRERDERGRAT